MQYRIRKPSLRSFCGRSSNTAWIYGEMTEKNNTRIDYNQIIYSNLWRNSNIHILFDELFNIYFKTSLREYFT